MDASHTDWFEAVFARFAQAIDAGDFVGPDLIDAFMCIATIEAGYRSAAQNSREVAIASLPA